MSLERLAFALAVLGLLALSNLPMATTAQTAPWIDEGVSDQYAANLIDSYNALIASDQASSPDFQNVEQNFSLYHGAGDSFQVLVVKSTTLAIHSNVTDTVAFIFTPIHSSQPQVVVDNNDTLEDLVGVTLGPALHFQDFNGRDIITPLKDGTAFFQYTMVKQGENATVPLIWVTSISHQVLNDTTRNAQSAGQEIYNSDATWMASHPGSPQTLTSQAQSSPLTYIVPVSIVVIGVLVFIWAKYGRRPSG